MKLGSREPLKIVLGADWIIWGFCEDFRARNRIKSGWRNVVLLRMVGTWSRFKDKQPLLPKKAVSIGSIPESQPLRSFSTLLPSEKSNVIFKGDF